MVIEISIISRINMVKRDIVVSLCLIVFYLPFALRDVYVHVHVKALESYLCIQELLSPTENSAPEVPETPRQ